MAHNIENLSPVKKKLSLTISPEEVDAAISESVAYYKNSVRLNGFRKGKAPLSIVEKRFHDQIYQESLQNIISENSRKALQELRLSPLPGMKIDSPQSLKRGEEFAFSLEFEVLPEFEMPAYVDMEVEQEKTVVDDKEVDAVVDRIRSDNATLVPVEEAGALPADGQVVNIDFAAFEGDKALDFKAEKFDLNLGQKEALEDFEAIIRKIPCGQSGEGEIVFPDDFPHKDFAGKSVTMKVTVNGIKNRQLPELNQDFATSVGMESVEKLREVIARNYSQGRDNLNKSATQKTLLDRLLKMCEFPLPESTVNIQLQTLVSDYVVRLQQQGQSLESAGKTITSISEELKPRAEEMARELVLLHSVAHKEGLSVSDEELSTHIFRESMRMRQDYKTVRENYERTGLIDVLRDRLLADKAMDLIYDKAKITFVEPVKKEDQPAAEGK